MKTIERNIMNDDQYLTSPENRQQLFELLVQLYPEKRMGLQVLMHKRQVTKCGSQWIP